MDLSEVGYQPVFDRCQPEEQESFDRFRFNGKYAFACAVGTERDVPDYEALAKAFLHDPRLATHFVEVGKPGLGYAEKDNFCTPDTLDCRHILSLTHLFSHVTDRRLNIVEIGGGFGNWARLTFARPEKFDCAAWTIIDIPAMIKLQKWYLGAVSRDASGGKLRFLTTESYGEGPLPDELSNPDVVIGAHSLSELPMRMFEDYFDRIIVNSRYFYYSTHLERPHPALIGAKLAKIENHFACVSSISSEGGTVMNTLYARIAPVSFR